MKIYVHTGKGHYIGSAVVVVAESKGEAATKILRWLNENGLDESLDIQEFNIKPGTFVYTHNGDY